jgi:eukaryotic-like serine/threonine-protein kinase
LLIDLKSLRRQFESGQLKYSSESPIDDRKVNGGRRSTATAAADLLGTDEARAVAPTSSAEYIVTEIKRHKTGVTFGLALIVVAAAGLGWGLYKVIQNRSRNKPPSFERMKVTRLTTAGKIQSEPAISPDGKYVAYAILDGDKQSLWITHVATNSNVQLIAPGDFGYWAVTFSPDGNYIYYHQKEKGKRGLTVYQVPVLGGTSKKVIDEVNSNITFSPDGKRFAFRRDAEESMIVIANADGSGQQALARRKPDGPFNIPAWSPDGSLIACAAIRYGPGSGSAGVASEIVVIRVTDGLETAIRLPRDLWASAFTAWLPDGSGLLITATNGPVNQDMNFFNQVWFVSYPSGEAHRITNDLNSYAGLSLAADGQTLVTAQSEYRASIWISSNNDFAQAKQIISGGYEGVMGLSWTPDKRIVYAAVMGGKWDLFIANGDASNRRQLTSNSGNNVTPAVTPDGRYVVFGSDRAGTFNLWRIDLDGSNLKQLTFGSVESIPKSSSDSQWIYYRDFNLGKVTISKVSINGGDPVRLFNGNTVVWVGPSPDGKLIAYVSSEKSRNTLYVSTSDDGSGAKELAGSTGPLVWSPDGKSLTHNTFFNDIGTTTSKVWSQPLDGGPQRLLFDASPDHIFSYDWSRDGKQIAFARGSITQDIVLISNFR